MYIAIEGIKGSGKSTIINELVQDCIQSKLEYDIFPITAPMSEHHPFEEKLRECPEIISSDDFVEKLFLHRAYWHQRKISWKSPIVIGDRSIATACVTRWNKWGDPNYTCNRVKYQYAGIMKPKKIIWLDTEIEFASKNISKRLQKSTGIYDETVDKLYESKEAYSKLFFEHHYEKVFGKVEVISVKNNGNIEEVIYKIKQVINN
jgi:thymidylate kinase